MIEIEKFNPCEDALEFRKQYPSFKEAWNNCQRGDWMIWIAKKLDVDADAAYAAYAAAAREQNRKSTADICREVLTRKVFEKLNIEI